MLNPLPTQLTPSCVENQGKLGSISHLPLSSHQSSPIVFFMFSLDRRLTLLTCVAERSVGERKPSKPISPHPMCPQNSFHPFQCSAPLSPPSDCIPSTTSFTSTPKSSSPPKSHKTPTSIPHVTCTHKPQADRSITHNELCPHVPAADHIFSWCTPFSSCHQAAVAQRLPDPLIESTLMAVWGALTPNTKSTYGVGPLHFTQFCDKWHITEEACMPANYARSYQCPPNSCRNPVE